MITRSSADRGVTWIREFLRQSNGRWPLQRLTEYERINGQLASNRQPPNNHGCRSLEGAYVLIIKYGSPTSTHERLTSALIAS